MRDAGSEKRSGESMIAYYAEGLDNGYEDITWQRQPSCLVQHLPLLFGSSEGKNIRQRTT